MKKWFVGLCAVCVFFFLSAGFVACSKEEAKQDGEIPALTEEEWKKLEEEFSEELKKLNLDSDDVKDTLDDTTSDELKGQLEDVAGELTEEFKNIFDDSNDDSSGGKKEE